MDYFFFLVVDDLRITAWPPGFVPAVRTESLELLVERVTRPVEAGRLERTVGVVDGVDAAVADG